MMRLAVKVRLVVVALVVVAGLAGATVVLGKDKDVSGTKHDVAAPGVAPCTECHIPRNPEGEVLWARDPNSSGPMAGMKAICFSCHDGTVTSVGTYVFDPGKPTHLSNPGIKGQDCDRCHDPHEAGYGKFVKQPRAANMCQSCHQRMADSDHPIDIDALAAGEAPKDAHFDPATGDFNGSRLFNAEGTGPGTQVKCLSCHSPHGASPGTSLNTVAFSSGHNSFLPLCANCHAGWSIQESRR
jgi:predicted CXXCH cytochrome family protein